MRKPAKTAAAETPKKRSKLKLAANIAGVGLGLAAVGLLAVLSGTNPGGFSSLNASNSYPSAATITPVSTTALVEVDQRTVETLDELLALEADERAEVDIARANLLVAKATPNAGDIDIDAQLATLDDWAGRVAFDTDRHFYKFRQNPAEFNNSEGYFRILMLVTVLQQDCGVRYNPDRINDPDFTKPGDLFIHGMIPAGGPGGPDGTHVVTGGTCVSMPVLYTAVARRLGYPVSLVTTKGHVFARWEDENERFNIEATSQGLNVYDDEFYKTWPFEITQREIDAFGLLRSLDADEQLALFLASTGHAYHDGGRLPEAIRTYTLSSRLDPDTALYRGYAGEAHARLAGAQRNLAARPGYERFGPRRGVGQDPLREIEEINRRNRERLRNPDPFAPPGVPGHPTPPVPGG